MSSANVVIAGTDAIANAYQGMIGAAADKRRRRMQSLLGIGQNLEDVVTQVKEAKEKRTEEAESKALTEALSLGLRDGDPSKAIDTIAATSATSPRVAQAKASLLLKLMDDKRQVEQTRATLKLQADQFAAQETNRKADNVRADRALAVTEANQKAINEDRDALRAINDENRKAEIKLKEQKASDERVELTRKDRAKYDAAQIGTLNSDLFTASYDREKNNGLSRADAFRERFEEQRKKMRDDSPEVIKAANETLEKLARLDRQDEAVKVRAEQREIEQTKANAKPLWSALETRAQAEGARLRGLLKFGQGQDDIATDIMSAVAKLSTDPAFKALAKVFDEAAIVAQIEANLRKAIGSGRPEERGGDADARYDLIVKQAKTKFNIQPGVPLTEEAKAWIEAQQGGQPKVDSKQSKPQTGEPAKPKTVVRGGVTYDLNPDGETYSERKTK